MLGHGQGTFNGLAAGMLLYLGAAMVLLEFGPATAAAITGPAGAKRQLRSRGLSFLALCIGVAAFAVLANWA